MIRATATVVLHNFSMYANAAAKGNAVLVTFHSQPWCLIGGCKVFCVQAIIALP